MIDNPTAATYLYGTNRYIAAEQYVLGTLTLTPGGASGTLAVIKRGPYRSTLGSQVDTIDITITNADLTYGGLPLAQAAQEGLLDGLTFVAKRVYDGTITVTRFTGLVQQVEPRSTETRLVVKSRKVLLDVPVPARTYQPRCPYKFKSTPCGVTSGTTCAKTIAACSSYSNLLRFGGFVFPKKVP